MYDSMLALYIQFLIVFLYIAVILFVLVVVTKIKLKKRFPVCVIYSIVNGTEISNQNYLSDPLIFDYL